MCFRHASLLLALLLGSIGSFSRLVNNALPFLTTLLLSLLLQWLGLQLERLGRVLQAELLRGRWNLRRRRLLLLLWRRFRRRRNNASRYSRRMRNRTAVLRCTRRDAPENRQSNN